MFYAGWLRQQVVMVLLWDNELTQPFARRFAPSISAVSPSPANVFAFAFVFSGGGEAVGAVEREG